MLRMLRAFAWMRWRMLVNSLELSGSRDIIERFSLAIEKLGPIIAALLLVPSGMALVVLGVTAGYIAATGGSTIPMQVTRFVLFVVPPLAVVGPLFLPAADRTNPIRLLLLPIPRTTLYVAQSSASFADPWTILMMPLVAGLPVGLAIAGRYASASLALAGGVLMVAIVIGIASLATSILHLIVRDRRRGELLALLFVIAIPVVAMVPAMVIEDGPRRPAPQESARSAPPGWIAKAGRRMLAIAPSELLIATATAPHGRAAAAVAGLATLAALLHGTGFAAFRKVLDSPGTTSARRSGAMAAIWARQIPGLSSGASAVATAQFRLALRTTRGRSILLSPVALLGIIALMVYRPGTMDFGSLEFQGGISLATLASFIGLVSILPIAMNQFAVDGAGLTMILLSPLQNDELLRGKAVGNALVIVPPVTVSLLLVLVMFPAGSPLPWITLIASLLSVYLVAAPIAAICSAVFPRHVDMNSIGRASNAHGAAGLLGLLAFLGAAVPPSLLTLAAYQWLDRPAAAPILVIVWCVIAYVICRVLFNIALRVFASRRENLALVV